MRRLLRFVYGLSARSLNHRCPLLQRPKVSKSPRQHHTLGAPASSRSTAHSHLPQFECLEKNANPPGRRGREGGIAVRILGTLNVAYNSAKQLYYESVILRRSLKIRRGSIEDDRAEVIDFKWGFMSLGDTFRRLEMAIDAVFLRPVPKICYIFYCSSRFDVRQ